MYLLFLTFGLCCLYVFLSYLIPHFFGQPRKPLTRASFNSIYWILLLNLSSYIITYLIPNQELGNRFVHAIGGGFVAFMACYFVVRDEKLKITKFQFFVFSFLLVTSLGVANELMELFLQYFTHVVYAPTIYDTWLDLLSNTVGISVAAALFVPLIKTHSIFKNK